MSSELEQAVEDMTGEPVEEQANDQVEDNAEIEQEQEPEISPDVEQASKGGWMPLDDWKAKGKDSDDWVSAKKFNERGQMMDSISSLRKQVDSQANDFGNRIASLTKLHEAQAKQAIANLVDKRDQAVDLADRDAVNKIQGEIDDINAAPVPQAQPPAANEHPDQHLLNEWNTNNPWIREVTPKSDFAIGSFNRHCAAGRSTAEAITMAEADLRKEFPPINSRRDNAPSVEGGRSKPGQRSARKLTWGDLSATEVKLFDNMPGVFSKDEYLTAVTDDRKGNK